MSRNASHLPQTDRASLSDPAGAQIAGILKPLADGNAVRETLPSDARLHIDRPLPFICLYEEKGGDKLAAFDVVTSNASYIVTPDLSKDARLLNELGQQMIERFGAFLVIAVSEFDQDRFLKDDSPYLPEFEIALQAEPGTGNLAAMNATAKALQSVEVKYRSPLVNLSLASPRQDTSLCLLAPSISILSLRFAPIYRQPESNATYPDLRERLVANIIDALLQGAAAFAKSEASVVLSTHRALGRRTLVEAVVKLDRQIDKVSRAFDFLMVVTPINADAVWKKFQATKYELVPRLLYRPLTIDLDAEKRALHAIPFENLEDPVLYKIYREKQQELDLQLTAIGLRDTLRFREASRLLYGPVETGLLRMAEEILALPLKTGRMSTGEGGSEGDVDCYALKDAACRMVAEYRAAYDGFDAEVVIRDDLPAGMMVSEGCLMISRSTRITHSRVEALLSHEIGVHLVTYFSGAAQELSIFRSGFAGYEGLQEGLAVFAEYLAGGLTPGRLRLLAARVVGCAAMLDGADFTETYRLLTREHGFGASAAFNLTVRLYRSGGLAKDAIYLRGLSEVLDHIGAGKSLDPFWLGKFSGSQLPVIEELIARGFLGKPPITPFFLSGQIAEQRLAAVRAGFSPANLFSE